jgi:hypothetical protein
VEILYWYSSSAPISVDMNSIIMKANNMLLCHDYTSFELEGLQLQSEKALQKYG